MGAEGRMQAVQQFGHALSGGGGTALIMPPDGVGWKEAPTGTGALRGAPESGNLGATLRPMTDPAAGAQRPTRKDVDIFGMCHVGLVRTQNQDHFLVATLHKAMQIHQTTLPHDGLGSLVSGARGYVFLVADGVGSTPWGEEASGSALRAIADYVIHGMDADARPDPDQDHRMVERLRRSVERGHQAIREAGEAEGKRGMATTLTMVTIYWPRAYVVHVGDSRDTGFAGASSPR